jgi:predicted oxidoreductase (fatty acid repression mutant protein)
VEADIKTQWKIPDSWKLNAQMPFGKPIQQPEEKQFNISKEHIRVYQ